IVLYTEAQGLSTSGTVPVLTGLTVSQANAEATNSGFNIKVTGISQNSGEVISYRQNVEAGTTAELGSTITVYFKTDTGVAD
ncbi:MAG: PASTA domain-containing protein, partial [Clostridiales bacterium]|nr:PASTA domain-containing protein [Clostridiales bacterium]